MSPTPFNHARQNRLDHDEGGSDVGVYRGNDVLDLAFPDRSERAAKTCVVNEDIHRLIPAEGHDGLAIPYIEFYGYAAGFSGQLLQPVDPSRGGVHLYVPGSKRARNGFPDTARGARYQRCRIPVKRHDSFNRYAISTKHHFINYFQYHWNYECPRTENQGSCTHGPERQR